MDMKRIGCIVALALLAGSAFAQSSEDEARRRLVDAAFKYRGVPYVYGAESPRAFDCSGFVRYVYREALGLELPRSARSFWSSGSPIDWRKARAGDVLVYDTVGGAPSHVALVVGDGTVIHAVSAGTKTGVIVSPMSDRYWAPRLLGARSFIATSTATVSATPIAPASPKAATAATPAAPKAAAAATPVAPVAPASPKAAAAATPAAPAAPIAPKAAPKAVPSVSEQVIADIGVDIPAKRASTSDRIPTASGTNVAFTVTNGTGRSSAFTVLFFVTDPKTYKLRQIHVERVKLDAGEAFGLPPYRFDAPGKYKLVVKDSWGNPLVEREFMVTEREET